jgi:O-antigen/teichoic acid export membrane protein
MSIKRSFILNVSIRWLGEIVSKIIWFLFSIYLARKLGIQDFGYFSYAFSLGSLFVVFTDAGTNNLIVKEISRDKSKTNLYLTNVLFIKSLLSVGVVFVIMLINCFLKNNFFVITFSISLVISAFLDVFNSLYRAEKKMYYETIVMFTWRFLIVVGSVIGISFFNFKLLEISYVFIVCSILSVITTIFMASRMYSFEVKFIDINLCKNIIKEALPLGLMIIYGAFFFKFNTVILKYFSSINDVGIYSAAFKIIEGLFFISTIFSTTLFPFFCSSSSSLGDIIIKRFKKSFLVLIIISLSIILPLFFYSTNIIGILYNFSYLESVKSLKILSIVLLFIFLNELYMYFFMSLNKHSVVNKIMFFGVFLFLGLNVWLVKIMKLGHIGSSLVLLIIEVFMFVLYSHTFFKISKNMKRL